MPKCDHCGRQADLPFDCPYCGGSFCSDHRLPPSHHCVNEEQWKTRASASREVPFNNDSPSLPRKECSFPGCGTKTPGIFYCPECGQDFCEKHKRHPDHSSGPGQPVDQPEPGTSHQAGIPSKIPVGWYGVAAVLTALVIMGGVFVIAGTLFHAGSGTTGVPMSAGCATERAAGTPPAPVPTLSPTAAPQQAVTTVTPSPSPTTTRTTAAVATAKTTATMTSGTRPATGTIVAGKTLLGGMGKMTIDNYGGSSDVVTILTGWNRKKTLIAVYIRNGASTTISRIDDGTYDLYVHAGENWNADTKRFMDNPNYWKFTDPIVFTSNQLYSGSTQHTSWTVRIYPSPSGNAQSEPVPEADFPGL